MSLTPKQFLLFGDEPTFTECSLTLVHLGVVS